MQSSSSWEESSDWFASQQEFEDEEYEEEFWDSSIVQEQVNNDVDFKTTEHTTLSKLTSHIIIDKKGNENFRFVTFNHDH
jgi:hypothetical protein